MTRSAWLAAVLVLPGLGGSPADSAAGTQEGDRSRRRTPVVEVFEASRDAVVNISSTLIVEVRDPFDQFFDRRRRSRPRQYKNTSVGSGFVIHAEGYIVTNAHVVARSTDRTVTFADGREFDAQVIASDREHDVAILKIDAGELKPLALGRSSDLMTGETVIAIGNPLVYEHTVTAGVVSAVNRDLLFSKEHVLRGLIQTDASINLGNSGGPLLNVLGELIGVNTAVRGDAQNIGFAIPVDQVRRLLPELLDVERRYRIRSGMKLSTTDSPRVIFVEPGSPAQEAGIRAGDVLREIDGEPVNESVDFHIALIGHQPGDRLRLRLQREDEVVRTSLELAGLAKPDAAALARQRLGVKVRPLPASLAQDMGLPRGAGLVVVEVEPQSPAGEIGMRSRDVLVALGRYYPTTVEELGQLLEQLDPEDPVSVTYYRVEPPVIISYQDVLAVR
ncbi:MAG: trypsin-like peptidase domain-containing protein [Planctomycetota bacterium]|jgi:serine protease Do